MIAPVVVTVAEVTAPVAANEAALIKVEAAAEVKVIVEAVMAPVPREADVTAPEVVTVAEVIAPVAATDVQVMVLAVVAPVVRVFEVIPPEQVIEVHVIAPVITTPALNVTAVRLFAAISIMPLVAR